MGESGDGLLNPAAHRRQHRKSKPDRQVTNFTERLNLIVHAAERPLATIVRDIALNDARIEPVFFEVFPQNVRAQNPRSSSIGSSSMM
jgi:hypothetical protein